MNTQTDGQDAAVSDIINILDVQDDGAANATAPAEKPEATDDASVANAVATAVEPAQQDGTKEEPDKKAEAADAEKATPPIEPPAFWDADAKEHFKALRPELQQVVVAKEREREAMLGRTQREAADERKAAKAEREAVQQERQAYTERLTHYVNMAETMDPVIAEGRKTDWDAAVATDPNAPTRYLAYTLKEQRLGEVIAERERVAELSAQEQQRAATEQAQEAGKKLAEVLKEEWTDPDKRAVFQASIKGYLVKSEYTPDELKGIRDPRALLIARKAMLYDTLMEQQAQIAAKKVPPAPLKIQKTKAADDATGTNTRADALWKRAAKSGRTDDQVDAVMATLNS